MSTARLEPLAIDYHSQPGRLRIKWSDGQLTDLKTDRLRKLCPCATCNEQRTERARNPLALTFVKADGGASTLARLDWVGNYGLMPTWGDGHDTGIYTYYFLRGLDNDP